MKHAKFKVDLEVMIDCELLIYLKKMAEDEDKGLDEIVNDILIESALKRFESTKFYFNNTRPYTGPYYTNNTSINSAVSKITSTG